MSTHLSVRLVWHDRAWDGHVCDCPGKNVYCVANKHIRDSRKDDEEKYYAKRHLAEAELNGWTPPCSRDIVAFATSGYTITHHDPLEGRDLKSVKEEIPAYSVCPSPYRWMREENFRDICEEENLNIGGPKNAKKKNGWVSEPDRQIQLLNYFWGRLEKHKSLMFFYCNHGNPLSEEMNRILIGVSRISEKGKQFYFGNKPPRYPDEYPVWSRRITHDYENQGFRLPYHEYIREGHDPSNIICSIPEGNVLDFSYVGEHVSDDVAVGALERLLHSVEIVKQEAKVVGDWEKHIRWLNDVLSEVWTNRGPYPGIGSVLQFLGFTIGTAFQRQVLVPLAQKGENVLEYTKAVLDGTTKCKDSRFENQIKQAVQRWKIYPEARRNLLELLCRFELTPEQVNRIANLDERNKFGIDADDQQLLDNPYLISELDEGGARRDIITMEVIDRGMRPEGEMARFIPSDQIVPLDDIRRVRATAVSVLKRAAEAGDTLLPLGETLNRIAKYFPSRRECKPDRDLFIGQSEFNLEALDCNFEENQKTVALRKLAELEHQVRDRLTRRVKKLNESTPEDWDWETLLEKEFGKGGSKLPAEIEKRARKEKAQALDILFGGKFSVLTGRAGTGKTSVLKVFLNGLEKIEGKRPVLLLAPTGKARVRLMDRTKRDDGSVRDAYTIHQFLMRHGWLNPGNFALRFEGGEQFGATTVIVDEASMIPMDLFGALFNALDLNQVKRLILVGDPNQLPPIGPGRPLVDIISWLEHENKQHLLAHLTERARHEDHNSQALQLADGYLRDESTPDNDLLLSQIAQGKASGDLEVYFYRDATEMENILQERMKELLGFGDDYTSFNSSLGLEDTKNPKPGCSENWQILSPVRNHEHGTLELNRNIQLKYKGGLIKKRYSNTFGEQQIVWTDKVIQIYNRRIQAWPRDNKNLNYVANGEIGLVTNAPQKKNYMDVQYSTQDSVSYRYFRNQVDENLELAYALTVHKAQGSDFGIVFLILPRNATTLSRELLYTGLTRFKQKMVLLVEKDTALLEQLRKPECSNTLLRNTNLFVMAVRPEDVDKYYANHLIHLTSTKILVRSKSELVIAETLTRLGISYRYEEKLTSKDNPKDFRLPDFTINYEGDTFYWEHLGMLSVPTYKEQWERKKKWYEENRYSEILITSEDGPDGSLDVTEIEKIARNRILDG